MNFLGDDLNKYFENEQKTKIVYAPRLWIRGDPDCRWSVTKQQDKCRYNLRKLLVLVQHMAT